MRTIGEWLRWLESAEWERWARATYGRAWEERQSAYRLLLTTAARLFGEQTQACLVRSPGRLNLMGRHIDHRGGFVHPFALPREILLVARPREDDAIILHHIRSNEFPSHTFRITEVAPPRPLREGEWEQWAHAQALHHKGSGWAIYAQAAAATMVNWRQELGVGEQWCGCEVLTDGNIPPGAGLSSSSALYVAFLLALLHCNNASVLERREAWVRLAEICGYGEWFVGTRGGAGDHAAILLSQQGMVTRIGFFPMTVAYFPFPADFCVLVMDSGERAHKAGKVRSDFNRRVAAYEVGMLLWQERFPELKERVRHLRDAAPVRLGDERLAYRFLRALPRYATFEELSSQLPHHSERLRQLAETCQAEGEEAVALEVRGTCWFGMAECERSERFGKALQAGDVEHVGELMCVSHDGDRVTRWRNGDPSPFHFPTEDWAIDAFEQNRVPFWKQAGSYRCSTPAIDFIVDTALKAGALGAQLSGAGLGGCAMALVRRDDAERVAETVARAYQRVLNLQLSWFIAEPCAGAHVLTG